ncbi:MAG TPA: DUF4396 domain-containing protein [Bryobacteraceae bacterium]|jgi:hypothetical protein
MIDTREIPGWLIDLAWISIILAVASAAAIAADISCSRHQKMPIMNIVWPVTGLYLGPVALWAYWRFGRPARAHAGNSDPKRKPFWAVAFVGDSHCGAGCTLGDFAGEWIVFLTGFTVAGSVLWADYAVDFLLAYLLGLIFQYFAIAPMRHLSGWPGVKAAIKADTISLVAFEIGMFAWMAFSGKVLFSPRLDPSQVPYWLSMQLAMVVGFATAFPANWWLIRSGLKEAM